MKFLFNGSKQLTSLETLIVQSCRSLTTLSLYCFPELQTLCHADYIMLYPSLENVERFHRLKIKHLYLENFPRITILPIWIAGAADTLETLVIKWFRNLVMLPECLTMTHLKRLHIRLCPKLVTLQNEFHRHTALEDLCIYHCRELSQKCQPKVGEYWPMIAHVKHISIGNQKWSHWLEDTHLSLLFLSLG